MMDGEMWENALRLYKNIDVGIQRYFKLGRGILSTLSSSSF